LTLKELLAAIKAKEESRSKLITETKKMTDSENPDMEDINKRMKQIDNAKVEIDKLNNDLEIRQKLATFEEEQKKAGTKRSGLHIVEDGEKSKEHREAINKFIRSKGQTRYGLVSDDVGVTIPEDIIYQPESEVKTVVDLAPLVNTVPVQHAQGTYPILKRATDKFNTVAELAANPELSKPEFTDVSYMVATYRGAIPLSQEALDDSDVDLTGIVNQGIQEKKVNTNNDAIATILKSFTAAAMSTVDDLKKIVNVSLDPAYSKTIVCSQSFYQVLDTLKDGNGRYLLQDSITAASGKTVLGMPVVVVGDTIIGTAAGATVAFIGDLKRAVLYANRADVSLAWIDSSIYGKYLGAAFRFGAVKADANAGFYVTYTAPAGD
jgi:HK97 family phage major capsid protein